MEDLPPRVKELKVNIPVELHLQLLRMKFLRGQTIACSVEEALRDYFATRSEDIGEVVEP